MKTRIISKGALVSFTIAFLVASVGNLNAQAAGLTPNEQLGKSIFFDENLSINQNQSCASCHGPEVGFTGPISDINAHGAVHEGSIPGRFGNRKPPSAAYATPSPILHFLIEKKEALFIGGNFWDGRATGEKLGNPAADQAQGPFLNPLEQALATPAEVVERVCASAYGDLFRQVWGEEACDPANVAMAYDDIALSIAAYEASPEVNAFTSKYDHTFRGQAKLTKQERHGFALFRGKGRCHRCHISNGQMTLFTDYTYDNLGVPKNPENPFYNAGPSFNPDSIDWIDYGLGGFLESRIDYASYANANLGKQKVPTLRNVGKGSCEAEPENPDCIVKAYGHNGYFKSLEGIVHFYNTRDVKPECPGDYTEAEALAADCWPPPEVPENVNTDELGDLGLTPEEEAAIVAFLKTLSDGFQSMSWSCDNIKPITALILVWDGADGIKVTTELEVIEDINCGDVIALDTENASTDDFVITISGEATGTSVFHLDCSDEDMNGPEDCSKAQGDGKANDTNLINDWFFMGMEGDNGILDCGAQ